jgi:site-specific DNA recombinase
MSRILQLGLLLSTFLFLAPSPAPPFSGTIFLAPDIITPSDPTTYQSVPYAGRGNRWMNDRRVNNWTLVSAFLFNASFEESRAMRDELLRQQTLLTGQQDRLLNMRLSDAIDDDTFAHKHTELRDRLASIKLQLDAVDRSRDETAELAVKVFELSQTLREQWLTAGYAAKRRILEILCLNCQLDGATLCPTIRKPFDVPAEGLVTKDSRCDRI